MIRPSFVPPPPIRRLRDVTRYRADLVGTRTAEKNRVEKLLEDALLTELPGVVPMFGGRGRAGTGTFPAHDRNGRSSAGSGVAGGIAGWVT